MDNTAIKVIVVNHLPVQHLMGVRHIAFVGRGGVRPVHQARVGIDADVDLHAEVPLVALLCLMHLGVARVIFVLRRRR